MGIELDETSEEFCEACAMAKCITNPSLKKLKTERPLMVNVPMPICGAQHKLRA
jgi:hypothetical protein